MFKLIYKYFERFDMLYCKQYGFREEHSTANALVQYTENLLLKGKKNVTSYFPDLCRAFDAKDHSILLKKKLESYGFRGITIELFKSHFLNRKQFLTVNDSSSSWDNVTCGAPRGSILGPMQFFIQLTTYHVRPNLMQQDSMKP